MGILMKETDFIRYMNEQCHEQVKEKGISLISLTVHSLKPHTNVVFFSNSFLFAAAYNQQLGRYSDGFFIQRNEMKQYELYTGILQDRLVIHTDISIDNQQKLQLDMRFPKLSLVGWHKRNLKRLKPMIDDM